MKKYILSLIVALAILALLSVSVFAADLTDPDLLVDRADLITDSEEISLRAYLNEISQRYETNVAIVTLPYTMNASGEYIGMTPEACANQLFSDRGYGFENSGNGVLFVIIMDTRDWYVASYGFAAYAITEAGYDYIEDLVIPYLSSGDYAQAFLVYAQICDELFGLAQYDTPYDYGDGYYAPASDPLSVKWIGICIVLGLVVSIIIVLAIASKNKSVRVKAEANSYVRQGSMQLTLSRDMFLYRNISKMPKSTDNNSKSGGRSGSVSSSGRGGKF